MRKLCIVLGSIALLAGLPATAQTVEKNAAALGVINQTLSAAHDTSYASYLTALNAAAPDLVDLANLPDGILEGDMTEAKLDAIGVALGAASQLSKLPFPSEAETEAVSMAMMYGDALTDYCLEADPIPKVCPQGLSDSAFLESHVATTEFLEKAIAPEAPGLEDTAAEMDELRLALPTIVDLLMDYDAEPIMNKVAVESACDLTRAIPLVAAKISDTAEDSIKRQSTRVYGRLFDLSGLPLCDGDGYVCRAAERCARSGTAPDCVALKVERIMTFCSADNDGLTETLMALQ